MREEGNHTLIVMLGEYWSRGEGEKKKESQSKKEASTRTSAVEAEEMGYERDVGL